MKKLLLCTFFLVCGTAFAAVKTPAQIESEINSEIEANGQGAITGPVLNGILYDITQSYFPSNAPQTWYQLQTFFLNPILPNCTGYLFGNGAAPATCSPTITPATYVETLEPVDIAATATFTNGSAVIGVTQTLQAGAVVYFTTSGGLPTNFVVGTLYYVSPTGLSGTTIQLNATPFGGTSILAGSAGTGTQTLHTQVPITSTNDYTFAALQLTAGTWDCEASGALDESLTTVTYLADWIANGAACTTPVEPADPGVHGAKSSLSSTTGVPVGLQVAIKRYPITVATTTTVCLQGTSTQTGGTVLGYGQIDCRRVY